MLRALLIRLGSTMPTWGTRVLLVAALGGAVSASGAATPGSREARPPRMIRIEDGGVIDEANVRTARETISHSTRTPHWTNALGFEHDVFTFVRLVFPSDAGPWAGRGLGPRLGWWVDYPDADLNLSWRLQQLTSLRTDPDCRVVRLSDPDLHEHPLIYLEHAGYMSLDESEVVRLRKYLRSGGVLFVNDFWSAREWNGFEAQLARVLPDARWTVLDAAHPVFHCLFDLRGPLHRLRVPTMQLWNEDFDPEDPASDPHRVFRGEGSETLTVRALHDGEGRLVALAIHNSDVSDGWEREGENDTYFDRFSERIAYPLGINVVFYLMTR